MGLDRPGCPARLACGANARCAPGNILIWADPDTGRFVRNLGYARYPVCSSAATRIVKFVRIPLFLSFPQGNVADNLINLILFLVRYGHVVEFV